MNEKWNVLIPDEIHPAGPESLRDIANCIEYKISAGREGLLSNIKDVDAIILRTVCIDDRVLDVAEDLKVISKHGTGVDMIDIEESTKKGIVVCNTPGANARAVAEYTITLMLACWKQLVTADEGVRTGNWEETRHDPSRVQRDNIEEKTLGLFGCGHIGSKVAEMANGLGMNCVTYDPYLSDAELPEGLKKVEKDSLFDISDIVSVHAPLTNETRKAISTVELRNIGDSGILVNTARGGIVDENALLDSLEGDELMGAALDVFELEPLPEDDPLTTRHDVVLSPHIAGASRNSAVNKSLESAENVRKVYEGDMPESTINRDDLTESISDRNN